MIRLQKVPVFILAGGFGTRISEETQLKPKPMVEIGEMPILLHIMRWYYHHGFDDFVICAGYRSWEIKNFFLNYDFKINHILVDNRSSDQRVCSPLGKNLAQENWRIRIIDTGLESMTGSRIARAYDEIVKTDKLSHFAVTYGDGLSDLNLAEEFKFHTEHGCIGTVLGVPPPVRFGELHVGTDSQVMGFLEKPEDRQGMINGGFFFFNSKFRKYLDVDKDCVLERTPLSQLAIDGQLRVFKHTGFWHPMDTLRDKIHLQSLWDSGRAPWKVP